MSSRVADSIMWMSRYVERADNVARFIDVNLTMSLDLGPDMENQWAPLVYTTGDHAPFSERYSLSNQENVIRFLTFESDNPNSILSCLSLARENARTVREMLSTQMWEELNKFYLLVRNASQNMAAVLESPYEFFDKIKQSSYILEGVTEATMSHGEAWHFRRLGRMIERADKTSRILDVKYFLLLPSVHDIGTPLDTIQWASLLRSASALEAYRQAHGRITPQDVAEFLILDRDFPRALRFCLINAEQSLLTITSGTSGMYRNRAEQKLGRLRSELDYTSVDDIFAGGLHEFIDDFQTKLNAVGVAINETFFSAPSPDSTLPPARSTPSQSQSQLQHADA